MRKISALYICLCFISFCNAQVFVTGKLVDEKHLPITAATVMLKSKAVAITDTAGEYSFNSTSLPISLTFSHIGFISKTIATNVANVSPIILLHNENTLAETIVNAFENNGTSIKNIPAAISVLNENKLNNFSNQSFVSAVNTVPGVKMDERSPGSYRLSIRGNLIRSTFGIRNIKVYWNGVQFTDANGNTYLNELAFNNIDKIEIIKGPSGSIYGTGTGGVVLLTNNFSDTQKKYIEIQSTAGSYALFSVAAKYVNANTKKNTTVSFNHQQSDGYRTQTRMRKDVVNFAGKYVINSKQQLSSTLFYSDLYYQTPGALTLSEMRQNPTQARPASGAFNSAVAQKAAIFIKTLYANVADEIHFNTHWKNTTGIYFTSTNFNNPSIRNFESKTETGTGLRTIFQYQQKKITVSLGGEYQHEFTNTSIYGNNLGVKDTLQYHDKINAQQYNIFAQVNLALIDDFTITAGMSFNNFYYGLIRVNQLPLLKQNGNFTPQLIPRVAISKKIFDHTNMYASVSKGFSPPSIDEIHASDGKFNTALNAEVSNNYEAGIKSFAIKNKLWLNAAYYFFTLKNTIVSRRDSSGAEYYINAGKTKQYGTEISINYAAISNEKNFIRQLMLWANYTNINATYAQYQQENIKYDGNKMTGTAPNVFAAGINIASSNNLYANIAYNYTDKIPLNDANTFFANAYNLIMVKVGYNASLNKRIESAYFFTAQKSFNNPYSLGNDLNAAGNRYYNPSAPNSFSIGAKFQFKIK
jgi:iron complex outermembrane receptor protein